MVLTDKQEPEYVELHRLHEKVWSSRATESLWKICNWEGSCDDIIQFVFSKDHAGCCVLNSKFTVFVGTPVLYRQSSPVRVSRTSYRLVIYMCSHHFTGPSVSENASCILQISERTICADQREVMDIMLKKV